MSNISSLGSPSVQHLIIRSNQRLSGTPTNFQIQLADNLRDSSYKLNYASIPVSFYTVTSSNNTFYWSEGSTAITCTLTPGFYTATSLASSLGTAMTSAGTQTYTISYSNITALITITAGSNFSITMGTNTTNSLASITGFNTNLSANTSQTAPNIVNLSPITALQVNIEHLSNFTDCSFNSSTFFIPVTGNPLDIIQYTPPDQFPQYITFSGQRQIVSVSLTDQNSQAINLNGLDFFFILEYVR